MAAVQWAAVVVVVAVDVFSRALQRAGARVMDWVERV